MKIFGNIKVLAAAFFFLLLFSSSKTYAQYEYKWMNIGSLHSYYTAIGSEIEEGRIKQQQDGMQWPALYRYQDLSAWKSLWIGAKNFTDASGTYDYKVVHIGPRVSGGGEFFPIELKTISKYEPSVVLVDDELSIEKSAEVNEIDPNLPFERMIYNKVNSLLGLTMERRIFAFSNPLHDNYIVTEYTYTNTGNADADADIELPNNDLTGVFFYHTYRLSPTKEIRYVIGNASGWGMSTALDTRGPGFDMPNVPENERSFRNSFAWHHYWPGKGVSYDNMGAPIFTAAQSAGYVSTTDTIGRLGAPQFVGVLTLHADVSASDSSDDPNQPVVARFEDSDNSNFSKNDPFDKGKMFNEYKFMTKEDNLASRKRRHIYDVLPGMAGKPFEELASNKDNPSNGSQGGYSNVNGYGPYDIKFGETIKIIVVEGAAGISRDKAIEIGRTFKQLMTDANTNNDADAALAKNKVFLTGKDSLMLTWKRATDNYNSGWTLAQNPAAPKVFSVKSGGDKITLTWEPSEDVTPIQGYDIYRAVGQYDSNYYKVKSLPAGEVAWEDTDLIRGLQYFYYIVSVGVDGNVSSRYSTQTYNPAFLKRPAGKQINEVRIVPNPFIIGSDERLGFGKDLPDRLAFYNIPGNCTIRIYSELGELINTIEHNDGSGDAYWDSVTSSKQIIVSGVYIAVITDNTNGEKVIQKFVIVR